MDQALQTALAPVVHMESQWDPDKLVQRLAQYHKNALKGIAFASSGWLDSLNEYADSLFSTMFQVLYDREWMSKVDFYPVLDTAVRELFPPALINSMSTEQVSTDTLRVHDRSYEEN